MICSLVIKSPCNYKWYNTLIGAAILFPNHPYRLATASPYTVASYVAMYVLHVVAIYMYMHSCTFCSLTVQNNDRKELQEATQIAAEIAHLHFTIKKRAQLGKHLGIPSSKLHDIELKAMEMDNTKEAALTEIILYFLDNNQPIAPWATVMDIVENKMGMSVTDVYEDRVTGGDVSQLGSCVEAIDIQWILHQLEPSIPKIVAELVTHRTTADDGTELKCFLQDWISRKKEDATWHALIRKIATIDKQAAENIRTMRCPADQEQLQDTRGKTAQLICKCVAMIMLTLQIY